MTLEFFLNKRITKEGYRYEKRIQIYIFLDRSVKLLEERINRTLYHTGTVIL